MEQSRLRLRKFDDYLRRLDGKERRRRRRIPRGCCPSAHPFWPAIITELTGTQHALFRRAVLRRRDRPSHAVRTSKQPRTGFRRRGATRRYTLGPTVAVVAAAVARVHFGRSSNVAKLRYRSYRSRPQDVARGLVATCPSARQPTSLTQRNNLHDASLRRSTVNVNCRDMSPVNWRSVSNR